jgi:hypothetical protein
LKMGIEHHPSTAFFSQILIFILCIHMVFAKGTPSVVELWTIQCQ